MMTVFPSLLSCPPFLRPRCTVACRIIFTRPVDPVIIMPIPSQFAFSHSGEKIFRGPNSIPNTVPHLIICNMISVGEAKSLRKRLISVACIFLSNSALSAGVSHRYRKIGMTKGRISLILELRAMGLNFLKCVCG